MYVAVAITNIGLKSFSFCVEAIILDFFMQLEKNTIAVIDSTLQIQLPRFVNFSVDIILYDLYWCTSFKRKYK